jgi:hypothetical protein
MNNDEDQLKLLTIFHYVVAGLAAMFALFPVIHLAMGIFFVVSAHHHPSSPGQSPPPVWFGWIFIIVASLFIAAGLTMSALILATGRSLARRKRHGFCLVTACVECLFMPFGTALGVFTIIVLNRASVKQLFGVAPSIIPAP